MLSLDEIRREQAEKYQRQREAEENAHREQAELELKVKREAEEAERQRSIQLRLDFFDRLSALLLKFEQINTQESLYQWMQLPDSRSLLDAEGFVKELNELLQLAVNNHIDTGSLELCKVNACSLAKDQALGAQYCHEDYVLPLYTLLYF
jgi:hypothetical protein